MLRSLDQIGAPIRGHRRKSHPATIPRTLLFTTVRRCVDNSLTCPDGSPESAEIRLKHVRNVEVGGSSPLTSTRNAQVRRHFGRESDEARVMSVTLSDLMFGSAPPDMASSATARTELRIARGWFAVSLDPEPVYA